MASEKLYEFMFKFPRLGLGQKDVAVTVGAERAASGVGVKYELGVFGKLSPAQRREVAAVVPEDALPALSSGTARPLTARCAFSEAIFQRKVPPQVQGRFFSALRVVSHTGTTLAYLLAGPLADRVLEPAMQPQGVLADTFGRLVGTGAGAGMALMFVFAGVLGVLVGIVALLYKPVRDIETLPPDHEPFAEEAVPQRA